jgi:glycosyltransferase involved in cell wall biosynthesis
MTTTRPHTVCLVTFQFAPLVGGAEKQAHQLSLKLCEKGWTVRVLTARLRKDWPPAESIIPPSGTDGKKVEIIRFPIPGVRFGGSLAFLIYLVFYLLSRRSEHEIIHVYIAHYSAFVVAPLGKLLGKRTFCTVQSGGATGEVALIQRMIAPKLFFRILRMFDKIIAVSHDVRAELLEQGIPPDKVVVIPNSVDVGHFSPGESSRGEIDSGLESAQRPVILFVGRLVYEKGLDVLLKAFRLLSEGCGEMPLQLHLVGDGPLRSELQHMADGLGIADDVCFAGNKDNVRDYMRRAQVFVLPSRSEGMPLALLEAAACGLPLIATPVSGSVEVIEDGVNGLLVPPEDPPRLAQALLKVLQDRALARRMGLLARQTVVDRYSLDVIADRHLALYLDLPTRKERIRCPR